ncbi:MAG: 50S ribosomal protein L19 [Caldilineae bacterium]|nr:MAG: 50S ribosomal protein L19 [Caldilineae bacterium]
MSYLIQSLENEHVKEELPEIRIGDIVKVHNRIVEGKSERTQVFQGTVIAIKGQGPATSITVRKIGAHGIGVERIFRVHAPRVEKIEVLRHSKVRRAKLYFLRDRVGKRARLKQVRR